MPRFVLLIRAVALYVTFVLMPLIVQPTRNSVPKSIVILYVVLVAIGIPVLVQLPVSPSPLQHCQFTSLVLLLPRMPAKGVVMVPLPSSKLIFAPDRANAQM